MKDTFYFRHDCNARQDEKILALRMKLGWEGYGIYWALIERLRECAKYECVKDYNLIAFDLRLSANLVKSIVEDFGLFTFTDDGKRFYSKRLSNDMNVKDELSASRSAAGKKGMNNRYQKTNKETEKKQQSNNKVITELQQSNNDDITIRREENKGEDNISTSLHSVDSDMVKRKAFIPPSIDEVRAYVDEKGYSIDAERFVDFYTSKGWMVGSNKMKDWKAAVRNWRKSDRENGNNGTRFTGDAPGAQDDSRGNRRASDEAQKDYSERF